MTKVLVHGASGRMGQAIVRLLSLPEEPLQLVHSFDRDPNTTSAPDLRKKLGDVDVAIDFSSPQGTAALLSAAADTTTALVIGTTGLGAELEPKLQAHAFVAPVLVAANTSVGVAVLSHLAKVAATMLGGGFDAEIVEMHHKHKVDAPSGTALRLADSVLEARGWTREQLTDARSGSVGPRPEDEVGVMTLRGGDVVGEHTLIFAGDGERVELTHRATDRDIFARGALRAARWVSTRPPGRYGMVDALGLGPAQA